LIPRDEPVPPQASHHDPYHYNNDTKNEMRKKRKILEKNRE
jgi:hypothetical protein